MSETTETHGNLIQDLNDEMARIDIGDEIILFGNTFSDRACNMGLTTFGGMVFLSGLLVHCLQCQFDALAKEGNPDALDAFKACAAEMAEKSTERIKEFEPKNS